jgi:hypothetical protein
MKNLSIQCVRRCSTAGDVFHQTSEKALLLCHFLDDRRDCRFSECLKRFDPALATNQVVLSTIFRGRGPSVYANRLLETDRSDAGNDSFKSHLVSRSWIQNGYLGNRYECYRVTRRAASIWARDAIPVKKFKSSNR